MGYKLITGPASEPVSLAEARSHLKLEDVAAENEILMIYIKAARQMCEQYTRRAIGSQTWELQMDGLSDDDYPLEKTPVQSITSVKYYDMNNVEQTLSSSVYQLIDSEEPNEIALKYGQTWPVTRGDESNVKIRFIAGYTTVPGPSISAMLLIIGHLYANREDVVSGKTVSEVPMASKYLMDPYRLFTF